MIHSRLLLLSFACCAVPRATSADVLQHSTSVPLQTTAWTETVSLPRFDPALGTLESVRITASATIQGSAQFESLDAGAAVVTLDFAANVRLTRVDDPQVQLVASPLFQNLSNVTPFDGTIDFAGGSGAAFDALSAMDQDAFDFPAPLDAVDEMLFVGPGSIDFLAEAIGASVFTGAGNIIVSFQQQAAASVSIEYTFTPPAQDPDCNLNMIPDEEDIATGSSTDCNSNGIPDECEPDCDNNGIINDCDPVECPCVDVHRRRPGSLLLFPEFQNGPGMVTVLTITNVNCDALRGDTLVELRYIDGESCLENNHSVPLTPCDKITLLASSQTSSPAGYAYAYAKSAVPSVENPSGVPLVFNGLIGQALVVSAFDSFEYSINAVSFRSPGNHGEPTDVDGDLGNGDGVRDLDNVEYEPAPDQLLMPRFLGQGTGVASQLVLVNLSGGRQFQSSQSFPGGGTLVRFLGYNDNEVAFAGVHSFDCWDKVPLVQLSGFFSNGSLKTLGDDPTEIEQWPQRESGWFSVFGESASSTAETIVDPAIYAFLVESIRNRAAADLPFEVCHQLNGDLLPNHILGDHPHVAGDNQ